MIRERKPEYEFLQSLPHNTVDERARQEVLDAWDAMAMPLDGMGLFREMTAQIGGILADPELNISKKAILVLCADNGIVEEGVSQTGREVTRIVAEGMGRGQSTVCLMARQVGADVIPADVGIAGAGGPIPGVLDVKVRAGSRNFRREPAMTGEETLAAVRTGVELVRSCAEQGYCLLGTGEMGIGNTTTSSAVAAALLHESAAEVTGRGAGLSDAALQKKRSVIGGAIAKYDLYHQDAFTVLQYVGGYDLAALAGVCVGGCVCRIPIVLDGVISMAAALAAVRMFPDTADFLIASHLSREPAAARLARELSLKPLIEGEMALGEGTGAAMLMGLLDQVLAVYHGLRSFQDAGIEPYQRFQ